MRVCQKDDPKSGPSTRIQIKSQPIFGFRSDWSVRSVEVGGAVYTVSGDRLTPLMCLSNLVSRPLAAPTTQGPFQA